MPMPDRPNQPVRRQGGGIQSLGAILGSDAEGPKRITLKGNYREPSLPFATRMKWFRAVQRLVAECSAKGESYPHKVMAVANVMSSIGDVCRLSIDSIAARAGCVPKTVQACIAWLEEHGAITWNWTARRHGNGRWVRTSNLYTLIMDFAGLVATVARAIRAIWRERPRVSSKGNECHGLPQKGSYQEQEEARRRLAEVARDRQAVLFGSWTERHAT